MESKSFLKNEIKIKENSISNQEKLIKRLQDKIDVIRKQISYREQIINLGKELPLEKVPEKQQAIRDKIEALRDKLIEHHKTIRNLEIEKVAIQTQIDAEYNIKRKLEQERDGLVAKKNTIPFEVSRGTVKTAVGIAAMTALGAGLMYMYNVKKDKSADKTPVPTQAPAKDTTVTKKDTTVEKKDTVAHYKDGVVSPIPKVIDKYNITDQHGNVLFKDSSENAKEHFEAWRDKWNKEHPDAHIFLKGEKKLK
ncbi:MAG: hypothetical protein WCO35_03750 [Candidatus Nomurabacteria bacterium]